MKLEHIGIAVKSLEESDRLFSRLLGKTNYKHETVEREGVTTSFYAVGESKVELLESSSSEGVIGRYIEKRGEGVGLVEGGAVLAHGAGGAVHGDDASRGEREREDGLRGEGVQRGGA